MHYIFAAFMAFFAGLAQADMVRILETSVLHAGSKFVRALADDGNTHGDKPKLSSEDIENLYSMAQRNTSNFNACRELFPGKTPLSLSVAGANMKPLALCSDNFAVLYSQVTKTPLVSVEKLTPALLRDAKGEQRTNQFFEDPRIPAAGRSTLRDYKGSGYDRGHMAPAADAPNQKSMAQSFALSNMVPQDPQSNQKSWADIEGATRKYALRAGGPVYVFSGPIFDKPGVTIEHSSVWVPTRLFKLVYDETSGRSWAYIMPNAESAVQRPVDYATFVRETGLRLLN